MGNKSKRKCCVPQCESKYSTETSFMRFPRDEILKKKWALALNIHEEINPNLFVCALHFLPNDFFPPSDHPRRKIKLKRQVIPSQNLPRVFIKSRRKAQHKILEDNNSQMKVIQDDSTKRPVGRPRRKNAGVPKLESSFITTFKNKKTRKSVGVQTETCNDLHVKNREENNDQTSLSKTIDYLRKNLVGHVVKIKENTFTINECSISFKNETSEEINMLVVQPDKMVSSGTLLLDAMLGSCEIGRSKQPAANKEKSFNNSSDLNYPNQSRELDESKEAIQYCCVELKDDEERFSSIPTNCHSTPSTKKIDECSIYNICDINKKESSTKKMTTKESPIIPLFDKTVQVLVKKLPENLVKAFKDGHKVRVGSKEHIKRVNSDLKQKTALEKMKVGLKQQPVKLESIKCGICKEIFPMLASFYEHKKIHKDASKIEAISKEDQNVTEDITQVVKQNEVEKKTTVCENSYSCDICDRAFKDYHLFQFHKETEHIFDSGGQKPLTDSGNCNDSLGVQNDKQTCPECLGVYQNRKQLDCHLLECHQTVLKRTEYECDMCSKTFITFRSLLYHKRTIHDIPMNENFILKLKCSICKKLVELNEYRISHLKNCARKFEQQRKSIIRKIGVATTKNPLVVQKKSEDLNKKQEEEPQHFSNYEELLGDTNENHVAVHRTSMRKRSSSSTISCDSQDELPRAKRSKLDEESGHDPADKSYILDRLKALLGSNEGPNEITIEMDE